ncbi:MAG: response regulator, partial [Candidatus Cloacimonadota bacterium]
RALVDIGYEIFSAQNAQEAEEIFKGERGKFNILFSDVMLPDKSGFYLAEQFLSLRPELKVILTSGYVGNESQRAIIREKGYHYIEKPYVLSDLLQVLSDVIKSS